LASDIRVLNAGHADEAQLIELRVPPDSEIALHAHLVDTLIYLVEGELVFEGQRLGPSSFLFVPGQTLYGFRSGPAGLRFLNFRPHADPVYITADEFETRFGGT
jgi:redox-sensitive bicupin YhaK (pirin superfamily)